MSSSASSALFLSFAPQKSLCNSKPSTASVCLSPLSSLNAASSKSISMSPSFIHFFTRPSEALPSRFVRSVSLYSDFEQEEEVLNGAEEPSYSANLKVFVGNLPFSVDSAALAGLFEQSGNVEMVEVIFDEKTGRSRGFGFVTMSTAEEAEAAAQQLNGYEIEGRALRVNAGPPPRKEEASFRGPRGGASFDSTNRLFVGNLSWGVDDLALKTLFSEQGKVMEAKVVYDRDSGRSRGFGFVTYSSADEVNNAIESLNGMDFDGRPIRVTVAEARPPRRRF